MKNKYSSEFLIQPLIMKSKIIFPSIKNTLNSLFIALLLFSSLAGVAQHGQYVLDHTSNVGQYTTAAVSNDRGLTPFVLNRKAARSRYLYLASELHMEGASATPRVISSLAFNVIELGSNEALTDYNISIAQTLNNNLANNMNPIPGSVLVKSIAVLKITELGWFEIEFDTPFAWNGTSNLIVEVCKTNADVIPLPKNVTVATTTQSSGTFFRSWALVNNINANPSPNGCEMIAANNPFNVANYLTTNRRARPNIRFTFKCNGNTSPGQASVKLNNNYCLGESVELDVINGERSSGLDYQWLSSDNNIDFYDMPGEYNAELVVERKEIDYYYLRATGCSDDTPDNGRIFSQPVKVIGVNTWNGTNWSMVNSPILAEPVRIDGDFDSALHGGVLEACSVEVLSGNVIFRSEHTLKIKDKLKVAATANVVFENNASLVQENNVANEGQIKYRRNSQPVRLLDYTYWSSPVSGQTPNAFSVGTPNNRIYHWNHLVSVQNWNSGVHNIPMIAGKGYIIRAPNGYPNSGSGQVFSGEFAGVPHNGDITLATQGKNPSIDLLAPVYWNLIGNPYPSALDADAFLISNSSRIDGTIKFWTHNSAPSGIYPGNQALNYNSNDYATYNLTGYVGGVTGPAGSITDPNDPGYVANTTVPGRYIAAGQSFMVAGGPTSGEGTVKFSNSMRVVGENKTFFKNANVIETIEKNRIWLEMRHEEGAFKQTLVGYVEGATNGLDWGFDGKMLETSPVLIYTKAEEQNLIIQGKGLPFSDTDSIPLGFSTTLAGNFDLNLYQFDGLFTNQVVFVEDTYTNTIHDLKEGIFSFQSVAGVFDDRFIIRFANETLSIPSVDSNSETILCYVKNQIINVKTTNQTLKKVVVSDVSGRIVFQNNTLNAASLAIETIAQQNQLLLVQVTNEDGLKSTFKIIY